MLDVDRLLSRLREERPVFHSEADFQHALAWTIHETYPEREVRLEYRPFGDERIYVDIWLLGKPAVAIELKYLTRGLNIILGDETFRLKNQAAQDISRYDVIKDLVRLERIVNQNVDTLGYAITLTNDSAYWKSPLRPDTVDADFRINDGKTLSGAFSWSNHAGKGTTKNREDSLELQQKYLVEWKEYSRVDAERYGEFRYLTFLVSK